jgi:hypothetical protein
VPQFPVAALLIDSLSLLAASLYFLGILEGLEGLIVFVRMAAASREYHIFWCCPRAASALLPLIGLEFDLTAALGYLLSISRWCPERERLVCVLLSPKTRVCFLSKELSSTPEIVSQQIAVYFWNIDILLPRR